MKLNLHFFFFFFFITTFGFSQTIKGKITDENDQLQPFANVILYQERNSNPLTGVISDDNGNYVFQDLKQVIKLSTEN